MKPEDKIMYVLYCLFGAFLGFMIYAVALGGWMFVLTGNSSEPWNGPVGLLISLVIGGGWGLVAYKFSDRELGAGPSGLHEDQAGAILFIKRLMVIGTCLAGLYFLWQLAKGL
jgi:hypothetical protein